MVTITIWATVARFETHQGSLCPPSKCREARTGLDAVILLSQEKVVFDDAPIKRHEKNSLLSILTVVTYLKSGIRAEQESKFSRRVKLGVKAGVKIRRAGQFWGRFCQCFGAGQH